MNNIEILEELIRDYRDEKEFVGEEIIKAIETLIAENKEQKRRMDEIKEKTKKCEYYEMVADELYKNSVSEDKIKAKIEEIKKYKDLARDSIEERIVIADSDSLNYGRKEAHEKDIEVLQSLLDKE